MCSVYLKSVFCVRMQCLYWGNTLDALFFRICAQGTHSEKCVFVQNLYRETIRGTDLNVFFLNIFARSWWYCAACSIFYFYFFVYFFIFIYLPGAGDTAQRVRSTHSLCPQLRRQVLLVFSLGLCVQVCVFS